jgi:hypothetical protein
VRKLHATLLYSFKNAYDDDICCGFGQNGDLDLIAVEAGKLFMLFQT